MTAPIPPPASHSYNDDDDAGPNIVSSDTEADPKSVFFLFCQPTFLFEGKRSGWHPYLEMQPGGKWETFLSILYFNSRRASYSDMDPGSKSCWDPPNLTSLHHLIPGLFLCVIKDISPGNIS